MRGLRHRQPGLGEPGQGLGHVGQLVQPQRVLAALPQPQGECRDRVPQLVQGQAGRPAGAAAGALDLEVQPGREHLLVQPGGAEGAPGAGDRAQPVVVEVGDEAEQPGVAAQGEQVGDGVQQRQPVLGGPFVTVVAVDQVGADLLRAELLDGEDPAVREQADAFAERGQHLPLGAEVLGAAGDHDLGAVHGGVQQHLQAFGGAVVGDLVDEFVEAVEEQHDPPLLEHVPEGPQIDVVDAVGGEVRGDQAFERIGPVQRVQFDQQRDQVREFGGDAAGELAQREGLAVPEVAEEQQEAPLVGVEQPQHLVDEPVAVLGVEAFHLPVALRQVHARGVARVGAQPLALCGDVAAQVQQALELGEAADAHAPAAGRVAQLAGGRRAVVDEFGLGLGVGGVHEGHEPVDVLRGRGAEQHGHALLADEAGLGPGDEELRQRPVDVTDLGALVAGAAHLGDPGEQYLGGARQGARLRFGLGAAGPAGGGHGAGAGAGHTTAGIACVPCGAGGLGAEGAVGPVPPDRPAPRLLRPLPDGHAVPADPQQLVPAGADGADHRHLAGGGGEDGQRTGVGRAVQQQVQPGSGQPGQHVGVAQRPGTVQRDRARRTGPADTGGGGPGGPRRVPYDADPQPALALVGPQGLREPGGLLAPDQPVLVVTPMAVRHGRVQPRDHGVQLGHGEEGPRLIAVEDDVEPLVQLLEQPGEVPPLGPVRRPGRHLVGLAGAEVGLAGRLVDVLAARDEGDPVRFEPEQRAQPGEEGEGLLELAPAAGGGQITGDDQQVRGGRPGIRQLDQVPPDRRLQLGGLLPPAEGGPGQLEHGDRLPLARRRGHPRIRRRRGGSAPRIRRRRGGPAPPRPPRPAERPPGPRGGRGGRYGTAVRTGIAGRQAGPGPPVQRLPHPGEQQFPRRSRLGDRHQVHIGDGGQQPLHRDVLDPHGDQPPLRRVRIGAQRGLPLHPPVPRALVVPGQYGDDGGGPAHPPVHEVHEVRARHEVPGLQDRAVSGLLQRPGDPGRPAFVGR